MTASTHQDPAFWDGIAESYAAKPVDDPEAFERKIAITREHMRPTDLVVDIGCGTGSLALILAPHAAEVHGLDLSPEMIRIARGKAEAQGAENVTFHAGPFATWDALEPGSIDVLCVYSLLHLVQDRAATLARALELMKPGGWLISSTVCLAESWIPYRPVLAVMRWVGKAPPVSVITGSQLQQEFAEAGFTSITTPDVTADARVCFLVARKPA